MNGRKRAVRYRRERCWDDTKGCMTGPIRVHVHAAGCMRRAWVRDLRFRGGNPPVVRVTSSWPSPVVMGVG